MKREIRALLERIIDIGPYFTTVVTTEKDREGKHVVIEKKVLLAKDQDVRNIHGKYDYEAARQMADRDRHDAAVMLYGLLKVALENDGKDTLHRYAEKDILKEQNLYDLINYCFKVLRELDILPRHDRFYRAIYLKGGGDGLMVPVGDKILSEEQVERLEYDKEEQEE